MAVKWTDDPITNTRSIARLGDRDQHAWAFCDENGFSDFLEIPKGRTASFYWLSTLLDISDPTSNVQLLRDQRETFVTVPNSCVALLNFGDDWGDPDYLIRHVPAGFYCAYVFAQGTSPGLLEARLD